MRIDHGRLVASAAIGLIAAVGFVAYAARGGDTAADPALARSKAARSAFTTRATPDPNRQLRHADAPAAPAPATPVVDPAPAVAPVVQQAVPEPERGQEHDDDGEWEGED